MHDWKLPKWLAGAKTQRKRNSVLCASWLKITEVTATRIDWAKQHERHREETPRYVHEWKLIHVSYRKREKTHQIGLVHEFRLEFQRGSVQTFIKQKLTNQTFHWTLISTQIEQLRSTWCEHVVDCFGFVFCDHGGFSSCGCCLLFVCSFVLLLLMVAVFLRSGCWPVVCSLLFTVWFFICLFFVVDCVVFHLNFSMSLTNFVDCIFFFTQARWFAVFLFGNKFWSTSAPDVK